MTQVAAEIADGMMMHPFSSEKYMREVTLPAIERGLGESNRSLTDFELDYAPIIASGVTEEDLDRSIAAARERIAFYGSTEAYKPVLDIHGWGELQPELHLLNRHNKKAEAAALITDDILQTIAVVGEPAAVVEQMHERLGGVISRTGFGVAGLRDDDLAQHLAKLRQ